MFSSIMALVLAFLVLDAAVFVNAGIYVFNPQQGATCHGGQPCTVEWVEDGEVPLLSAVGITTVGLYTGKQQLVQYIQPVDVSEAHSLTFTPNPAAGANSADYYISFLSTSLKVNGSTYGAFSPFFKLDQMTGSFDSPLASATSSIPIPSSLTQAASASTGVNNPITTTITVGTLTTSVPTTSRSPSTTKASSSATHSLSASASSSSSSSTSSQSASSTSSSTLPSTSLLSSTSRFITSTSAIPSVTTVSSSTGTAASATTSTVPNTNAAFARTIPTALLVAIVSFALLPLVVS